MQNKKLIIYGILVFVVIIILSSATYTVNEWD
jgi:hypothetical protein